LDKVKEVKEEFDLIFISFLDNSLSRLIGYSNCTIKHEDRILYSLHIRYKMDTDLEYMTKTLSEVSEDMFDIESYNKYIKSKYQSIRAIIISYIKRWNTSFVHRTKVRY
jgi:hypothetical protein